MMNSLYEQTMNDEKLVWTNDEYLVWMNYEHRIVCMNEWRTTNSCMNELRMMNSWYERIMNDE
jgi:hypothetical protein